MPPLQWKTIYTLPLDVGEIEVELADQDSVGMAIEVEGRTTAFRASLQDLEKMIGFLTVERDRRFPTPRVVGLKD